jgi:hypothetical protein
MDAWVKPANDAECVGISEIYTTTVSRFAALVTPV